MFQCQYKPTGVVLGEGSYGRAEIVKKDGREIVLKSIMNDKEDGSYFFDPVEVDIMFRLRSPYLVEGLDITVEGECHPSEIGIVTEFISGNIGKDLEKLSYEDRKRIMYGVALGLKCLHDNNYIHLDIKLDNMMYHKEIIPRGVLIDYGLASYCPEGVEKGIITGQARITPEYNSPKTASYDKKKIYEYNGKDDIWSLGLTFIELMMQDVINQFYPENMPRYGKINKKYVLKPLHDLYIEFFNDKASVSNLGKYLKGSIIDSKDLSKLIDLLKHMLKIDEKKRFNIDQVVNHEFFAEYEKRDYCMKRIPSRYLTPLENQSFIKDVVKIDSLALKKIPDESVNILFMAYDIYLRVVAMGNFSILKEINQKPKLFEVCLMIANNYLNWGEIGNTDFSMEIEKYRKIENIIYKIIGGRINDERYCSNCKTVEQLAEVHKFFIKSSQNLVKYLEFDGEEFVKDLPKGKTPIDKMTIKEFLKLV